MIKFFLDTYALIRIIEDDGYMNNLDSSNSVTFKTNLVEFYYIMLRDCDEEVANFFYRNFLSLAKEIPDEIIPLAAKFRFQHKKKGFSYADALGYQYALSKKVKFVTGDRSFEGMRNVELAR